jgi:hypothetical protein
MLPALHVSAMGMPQKEVFENFISAVAKVQHATQQMGETASSLIIP